MVNAESAILEFPQRNEEAWMRIRSIAIACLLPFLIGVGVGAMFAQQINDAQIAHIVVTANQVDIDAGRIAESKGNSAEVKMFGKMMVTDHANVNSQATELAARLKLTPQENPTSQSLKMGGETNVANLKSLSGPAFDKAYISHEVEYHQAVVDTLNKMLLPSAQNAELKALISKVTPAFAAHLEKAKQIQAALAK
jgi:putative membrane protein